MTTVLAPRLRGDSPVYQLLAGLFNAWAEHHDSCPKCRPHDWYDPGAPRPVTPPTTEFDRAMSRETRLADGSPVWFRDGPDPSVLCNEGARLWRRWQAEAGKSQQAASRELESAIQ